MVPHNEVLCPQEFTFSVLCSPSAEGLGSRQVMVSNEPREGTRRSGFWLRLGEDNRFLFTVGRQGRPATRGSARSTTVAWDNNGWFYIHGAWDGERAWLYVNGSLEGVSDGLLGWEDLEVPGISTRDPLMIVCLVGGAEPFTGPIAGVQLFPRALHHGEIAAHAAGGPSPEPCCNFVFEPDARDGAISAVIDRLGICPPGRDRGARVEAAILERSALDPEHAGARLFHARLRRSGPGDCLGLNINYSAGGVIVEEIIPRGVVDRVNMERKSRGHDDALQKGDEILSVNRTCSGSEISDQLRHELTLELKVCGGISANSSRVRLPQRHDHTSSFPFFMAYHVMILGAGVDMALWQKHPATVQKSSAI